MDALRLIENALAPVFRDLPALPARVKQILVKYWPYLAIISGVLQLVTALSLWRTGHAASNAANYINQLSIASGNGFVAPSLTIFYFLGIAALVLNGWILLTAYAPLKARRKKGWDLLFLGTIINIVYGVLLMFDGYYGNVSSLLSVIVGSAIGWYFLFQVRDFYTGTLPAGKSRTTTSTSTKK